MSDITLYVCPLQVSLILNMSADVDVLDVIGLLPHRHRIRKDLLAQLTASCDTDEDGLTPRTRHDTPPRIRPGRIHRSRASLGSDDLASIPLVNVPEGGVLKDLENGADANKLPTLGMTQLKVLDGLPVCCLRLFPWLQWQDSVYYKPAGISVKSSCRSTWWCLFGRSVPL